MTTQRGDKESSLLEVISTWTAGSASTFPGRKVHQLRLEKAAQMAGVAQAFADAEQEHFERGTFRVRRSPASRTLGLPLRDDGPLIEGKIHLEMEFSVEECITCDPRVRDTNIPFLHSISRLLPR